MKDKQGTNTKIKKESRGKTRTEKKLIRKPGGMWEKKDKRQE